MTCLLNNALRVGVGDNALDQVITKEHLNAEVHETNYYVIHAYI